MRCAIVCSQAPYVKASYKAFRSRSVVRRHSYSVVSASGHSNPGALERRHRGRSRGGPSPAQPAPIRRIGAHSVARGAPADGHVRTHLRSAAGAPNAAPDCPVSASYISRRQPSAIAGTWRVGWRAERGRGASAGIREPRNQAGTGASGTAGRPWWCYSLLNSARTAVRSWASARSLTTSRCSARTK